MFSEFLNLLIYAYIAVVFLRVVYSWIGERGPLYEFIASLTEPLLEPIRRVTPRSGLVDFSPTILILLLVILQQFIHSLLR